MSREPSFGREKIQAQFRELAGYISSDTAVYLIGGGALTLTEQKDATKDIDLVVDSDESYSKVVDALKRSGYNTPGSLEREYEELGASVVLQRDDERFDVFNQRIAGELVLSESMKNRSSQVIEEPPLYVYRVADEDIFLFKAVAGRTDDITDMAEVLGSGLDFDLIEREIEQQVDALGDELFITYIAESLDKLRERHGIQTPLLDFIDERSQQVYQQLELLIEIPENGITKEELLNEVNLPQSIAEKQLTRLHELGRIEIKEGTINEK